MDVKVFKTSQDPLDVSDWSTVIAGFDLVAQLKRLDPDGKYVLNASLGGGFNQAINRAAAEVASLGVLVIVAAGDDDFNACSVSPAAQSRVITVASSTINDTRSDFSNWGPCVDMFAPGSEIESASNTAIDASMVMSGTGMAAAHVAGIAAILLERGVPFPNEAILGIATPDVLTDVRLSPNRLAFNGYFAAPTPPPTPFSCPPGQSVFKLDLYTDSFPREIYWNLKNECTGKPVDRTSPGRYTKSNTEYVEQFCIDSTRHTFTIFDVDGDGLIAPGRYDVLINGIDVASGGGGNDNNYGESQSTTFGPRCPSPPTTAPTIRSTQAPSAAPNCERSFGATISNMAQRGWAFFGG
jgi:Subtilase family